MRRWEESGNLSDQTRGRLARRTTPEDDQRIRQAAENHPLTNAVAIRDELHLDVSAATVRRQLREAGMRPHTR